MAWKNKSKKLNYSKIFSDFKTLELKLQQSPSNPAFKDTIANLQNQSNMLLLQVKLAKQNFSNTLINLENSIKFQLT